MLATFGHWLTHLNVWVKIAMELGASWVAFLLILLFFRDRPDKD